MEQITIKIDEVIIEKMQQRMSRNGCKTFSQCARELIELALRIEEASLSESPKNDKENELEALLKLLKTNLTWSLENRFLLRFLIKNDKEINSNEGTLYMTKAKERADVYVKEMLLNDDFDGQVG